VHVGQAKRLAADLQLASALPKIDLVEYKTGSAYVDEVVSGGWGSCFLKPSSVRSAEYYS
jgi:hypothetical protein